MLYRRRTHATDDELSAHLDGRLAGRARARVVAHVDTCATCRQTLDELRAVQTSLRALPRAQAGRSFALRGAQPRPARPLFTNASPLLGGVAAFAMIAFLFVVFFDVTGGVSLDSSGKSASTSSRFEGPAAFNPGAGAPSSADTAASAGAQTPSVEKSAQARSAQPGAATQESQLGALNFDDSYQALRYVLSPDVLAEDESAGALAPSAAAPAATSVATATGARAANEDNGPSRVRIAEAALAAVALVSAGGAFVIARRRTI